MLAAFGALAARLLVIARGLLAPLPKVSSHECRVIGASSNCLLRLGHQTGGTDSHAGGSQQEDATAAS